MSGGQHVRWFQRDIELDGMYYVYFYDKPREMTGKEREDYANIQNYPEKLKWNALAEMDPAKNPNVTPMTGRQLMDAAAKGYIPQFDRYFESTHRLTLLPAEGMEFFMQYSKLIKR